MAGDELAPPELRQQRADARLRNNSPTRAVPMTKINPTDYKTWDLRELEDRWASVSDAVQKAASRIDLGGMRRNRRPVEYAWLAERGRLGAFDLIPVVSGSDLKSGK
jgi:hypothetical protein